MSELPLPPPSKVGWPWIEGVYPLPASGAYERPWPRISIVTPSFNQGVYLEQALRSLLLQRYPDLEIIVIDGGSTDGSPAIIERYAPWLAHWRVEKDRGPADALNKGFALATGEIFGFLNADDFHLPGCLATIAREFRLHAAVDVISGHGYFANENGELGTPVFSDPWKVERFLYGACVLVQQSTFFRRSVFMRTGGFNVENRTCWDMELWGDMARHGARFLGVDDFLATYRLHGDSISGNEKLREFRLAETRATLQKMRGRSRPFVDRAAEFIHHVGKFSEHPRRTLSQRLFLYTTLGRWSL